MGEQEQRVEFETRIGAKELMDFKIYHNYHSVSGIASLLFGIIALVICIVSINRVNISYTLMMGFFGLFFTVYTPIGMKRKVNKQIKNEMLEPVLRYGILKERMSALITDAVRADLLESKGYDTQILEFIDMEHTPKNLLIRAVRTGKRSDQGKVEKMLAALNIHPTLDRLLNEKEQEGSVR